ncbi:MAG TPA: hypothetical protein VKR60_09075 [Candidatus Sulfotelmatobacter sp.]|nr:hypothetical protein [Candidatus Sulfotelmatobacter sp.]
MIRSMVSAYFVLGVLFTASMVMAQDFSADVINARGSQGIKKVYSTRDKVRYEVEGDQAMGPIAAIVDETQKNWVVLLSGRHMYIDGWPPMMQKPIITQYWHVQDVNDACPQWKKLAEQAGTTKNWGSCTKIGSDTVGGRSTVKYEGVSSKGDKSNIWVDTKLHCVIKMDGVTGGGIELTNIKEGAQPAGLFTIPAGYTRFDMASMMQR